MYEAGTQCYRQRQLYCSYLDDIKRHMLNTQCLIIIKTHEFARIVNESDNYFVIICRDALPQLPYSIEEIYGMRTDKESQKYIEPKKTYNELYKIYNLENNDEIKPDVVMTHVVNTGKTVNNLEEIDDEVIDNELLRKVTKQAYC